MGKGAMGKRPRADKVPDTCCGSITVADAHVLGVAPLSHPGRVLLTLHASSCPPPRQNKRAARVEREEELNKQLHELNNKANKPIFAASKRAREEEEDDDDSPAAKLSDRLATTPPQSSNVFGKGGGLQQRSEIWTEVWIH